jgi:hypothetical protein
VKALGLAGLGVPSDDFEGTVAFFRGVLGLAVERK